MAFKEKECAICSITFQPNSGVAKVCDTCRPEWQRRKKHDNHLKSYKQKGDVKWAQPKGKDSPSYKTGIGVFNRLAFENLPNECNRCGSLEHLCVHHKDRNRNNNELPNLEILCKKCHQNEHEAGKNLVDVREKAAEAARAYQLSNPKRRDELGRFRK